MFLIKINTSIGVYALNAQPNCTKRCLVEEDSNWNYHVSDCGASNCNAENSVFIPNNLNCSIDDLHSGVSECPKANQAELEAKNIH